MSKLMTRRTISIDVRTDELLREIGEGNMSGCVQRLIWQEYGRRLQRQEMAMASEREPVAAGDEA
jgi:hypothetical protein